MCDPAEVAQWQWVDWATYAVAATSARSAPWLISPWSALQVPLMLGIKPMGQLGR